MKKTKTIKNSGFKKSILTKKTISRGVTKLYAFKVQDLKNKIITLKEKLNFKKVLLFIQRKPFTSFFAVLGVLLLLMIIGNVFFATKAITQSSELTPKKVNIFKIGSAPQISYQGKIEKSGVIKIVAQMPGIVSSINVTEGQQVNKGTNILSLSSNYQGGNALSVARQIAQAQYQNTKDTYEDQKDLIQKQKALADKSRNNSDQLRNITNTSATESANLAKFNQSIVDTLNQNLQSVPATDSATILQIKGMISQYQSAITQLNSSTRNLQYQGAGDQPPADLAKIQHDLTIKQLDIQQKTLDMSMEISRLQLNLAYINEANMYPVSPFAGTVDRIFVHVGDTVSPGMTLASLSGESQHAQIVASVPENIAKNISMFYPSVLTINNKTINMIPTYVSKDATNGALYSVIYQLDDSFAAYVTNAAYINVSIPVGIADTTNAAPYIPLDSIIQTQENAFVFIADSKNVAKVKTVTLGQIQGGYVEIISGLPLESQVILNRNVIEGDKVQIIR